MFDRAPSERDATPVLRALARQWWLIVLVAVVAGVAGYVFTARKPKMYQTSSALLFLDTNLDQELTGLQVFGTTDPVRQAATNQSLVSLPTIAQAVGRQLQIPGGIVASEVSFASSSGSDVLRIIVTDASPVMAAKIANAYARQYIVFRQQNDRRLLSAAATLLDSKIAAIPPADRNGQIALTLLQDRNNIDLLSSLQTGHAEQVQTASVPTSPSSPKPKSGAATGLVLGLVAAMALIAALERIDRRVKSTREIEELYGVPVIGRIPTSHALSVPGAPGNGRDQDAFGMMRAQLRYFDVDREIRRVIVTSADAGDGKSMISLNLARAAMRADDRRVLLIEADMRRPGLTRSVGLESVAGLADLLSQSQDVASAVHELVLSSDTLMAPGWSDDVAPFHLLLAGSPPLNPIELLEGRRMIELLEYVGTAYDLVIIDTPPIGVVSDAIPLIHKVDGIMVVSRVNHSRRDHALRLVKQLRELNAHVLGLVVNAAETPDFDGYYDYDEPARDGGPRAHRAARGA